MAGVPRWPSFASSISPSLPSSPPTASPSSSSFAPRTLASVSFPSPNSSRKPHTTTSLGPAGSVSSEILRLLSLSSFKYTSIRSLLICLDNSLQRLASAMSLIRSKKVYSSLKTCIAIKYAAAVITSSLKRSCHNWRHFLYRLYTFTEGGGHHAKRRRTGLRRKAFSLEKTLFW